MRPRGPGRLLAGLLATVVGLAPAVGAQEAADPLLRAIRGVGDGQVALRFEIDDGVLVCDDGSVHTGEHAVYRGHPARDRGCRELEATVIFSVRDGRIHDASRPSTGDGTLGATELGPVEGPRAAELFMEVAARAPDGLAGRMLLPAVLARNGTVWPRLVELARDRERSSDLRRKAVFWLGQEAAAEVSRELVSLARDDSQASRVRDAAVFALSQRPDEEGVPALMELVHTSDDPRVRKKAIFWLAQSRDPRVVPFFESILSGGPGG